MRADHEQLHWWQTRAFVVAAAGGLPGELAAGHAGEEGAQHGLRRGDHAQQAAILGHQHVAPAHHGAARQKHAQVTALAVGGVKAAFLAHVPVQLHGGGAFEQHGGQALALGDEFGAGEHGKKVWEQQSKDCTHSTPTLCHPHMKKGFGAQAPKPLD